MHSQGAGYPIPEENWSLEAFLADLLEQEMEGRRLRRTSVLQYV